MRLILLPMFTAHPYTHFCNKYPSLLLINNLCMIKQNLPRSIAISSTAHESHNVEVIWPSSAPISWDICDVYLCACVLGQRLITTLVLLRRTNPENVGKIIMNGVAFWKVSVGVCLVHLDPACQLKNMKMLGCCSIEIQLKLGEGGTLGYSAQILKLI